MCVFVFSFSKIGNSTLSNCLDSHMNISAYDSYKNRKLKIINCKIINYTYNKFKYLGYMIIINF